LISVQTTTKIRRKKIGQLILLQLDIIIRQGWVRTYDLLCFWTIIPWWREPKKILVVFISINNILQNQMFSSYNFSSFLTYSFCPPTGKLFLRMNVERLSRKTFLKNKTTRNYHSWFSYSSEKHRDNRSECDSVTHSIWDQTFFLILNHDLFKFDRFFIFSF
jgi:hypothetical protein